MTKRIVLVLVTCWLGWTVLVDFFVVPTVFRNVHDFFLAGELGIALFSGLNTLELIVSTFSIGLLALDYRNSGSSKSDLILLSLALLIVIFYFAFLTPKITGLTQLWKMAEAKNQIGVPGISDIQQEHQYYHRIYVALETVKLIILMAIISLQIFVQEKKSA